LNRVADRPKAWIVPILNWRVFELVLIDFAQHFDLQNRIVANEIRRRYNIPVMTLLPFVTPNMEGHKFTSPFGALNA
jgi:hypothetical protein